MRVLLVEDDKLLGDGIRAGLKQQEFVVDWVLSAEDGVNALESAPPDSYTGVILDLGLPGMGGLEFLKRLRKKKSVIPVLILTARDTVRDRVTGLDAGADDYLTKPFSIEELAARLRALIRRSKGHSTALLTHGNLTLDPAAHRVTQEREEIELSPKEFAVLKELLENVGSVLSRERLEEQLYGWNEEVESNAVEVHIHHLRRKLGSDLIRTVRGVGYIMGAAS